MRKYFGTDGVRGIANDELTPTLAFKLARAGGHVIGKYSHHDGQKAVAIIGTDTRISKDTLKFALMSGFTSVGIDVIDAGIVPTPAIAYLTRKFKRQKLCYKVSASEGNHYTFYTRWIMKRKCGLIRQAG